MKAIETKYLGPTDFKGSRVKAFDNTGNSITLSWDSALNPTENHERAVKALCEKLSIPVAEIYSGDLKNSLVHLIRRKEDRRTVEFKGPMKASNRGDAVPSSKKRGVK